MEDTKTKVCIYYKRLLSASIESFTEEKKGKYKKIRKLQYEL